MKQMVLDLDEWFIFYLRQPNEELSASGNPEPVVEIPEELWDRYSASMAVFSNIQEELRKYHVK